MGLGHILFVTIPEETLLLIFTLLVMRKKEYLNLRNTSNVLKMLSAVILTTLFSVLLNNYIEQYDFMMFVRVLYFVLVYWLIYKTQFLKVLLGFVLALFMYIMGEYLGTKLLELFTGITNQMLVQEYSHASIYPVLLIPRRILQIIVAVLLYKLGGRKKILLKDSKNFNIKHK